MKRVEHLKHALRGVFADVDSAAEDFAGRIDNDELDVIALAGMRDATGDFSQHGFIEEIVFRTVESHSRDAVFDAEFYALKFFG